MTKCKTYRLGELIEKVIDNRGKSPQTSDIHYQPLIEINALGNKEVDYSAVRKYVDKDIYDTWFRSGHPKKGDILFSTVGTIGIASYMSSDLGCIAQNIIALRTNELCESEYLYYYLISEKTRAELLNLDIGGVQPSIKVPHLLNIKLSLPPLSEQKRIAGILSALDDKIDLNRRINANLEAQAMALYKHWFVDFEFPNAEGKPYKSFGGKMIKINMVCVPEGWSIGRFGDIIQPKKGKNITRAQVKEGIIPVIAGGLTPSCYHNIGNTIPPVITISASGANAGYVNIHYNNIWAADCSYIDASITPFVYWAYIFLKTNQKMIYHKQQGCAQPHIYPSHLMELNCYVPPIHLLNMFDITVRNLYLEVSKNIQEIQILSTLRDTLLPKLLNGDIRV